MYCPNSERITVIEYGLETVHGMPTHVPLSVSSLGNQYDFEWCRRNGSSYYHLSGAGYRVGYGHFTLAEYCKKRPRHLIWYDPTFISPAIYSHIKRRSRGVRSKVRQRMNRLGYFRIKQPLILFGGETANPFEWLESQQGECEYCRVCKDWLPVDYWGESVCEHIDWCEEHAMWCGPGADDSCGCDPAELEEVE
jgi:hypothetical protein